MPEINRDKTGGPFYLGLVGLRSTLDPLFRTSVSTVFEPRMRSSVREIVRVEGRVWQGVVFAHVSRQPRPQKRICTRYCYPCADHRKPDVFAGGMGPQHTPYVRQVDVDAICCVQRACLDDNQNVGVLRSTRVGSAFV